MSLLALAIAPGIAICLYIFLKDIYNKEPKRILAACFALGIVAIIPPYLIESFSRPLFGNSIAGTAFYAFGVVGLSEEFSKYFVLRYYAYNRKSFDEPMDGIVYSVMISMGFATIENIGYVLSFGYETAFVRMFLSVPAHASFAVPMGYFIGKARFDSKNSFRYMLSGLAWAVFFHGTFDLFLFLQKNPAVNKYVSDTLLFAGAIISYLVAVRLSRRHIKLHSQLSEKLFRKNDQV